ncbi:MAG: class I mannose-6-phosphate isomerase [Candidatus Amulumruptor caecigallinarius]|nr:class I mannose-6-phosphate isomerase [Candidatus Amulumruptor caecigallinarius]
MWIFSPIFKSTIWGGDKIGRLKGDVPSISQIGESWELSGVPGEESVVADGPDCGLRLSQLIERYGATLTGERNFQKYGTSFPLLVKIIDASKDLSIQVHPDDDLARRRGLPNGKSEMWYVIQAEKNAKLVNGFSRDVERTEYPQLVSGSGLEDALNNVSIKPGEVYYIPAGRVHAIGAGTLILEIQQASDATYRIYDYHRKDATGKERELHTDLALEAIDFKQTRNPGCESWTPRCDIPVKVVRSPYFAANVLEVSYQMMRDFSEIDTFIILVCISGEAEINCRGERRTIRAGHTVLIEADANAIEITPREKAKFLEVAII